MLRLLLCCSYCLNVVVSAWTLNQVDAAAKHSSNRAPALTYTVPPTPPFFLRRKTNIAKHTWKRIGCSYCWVALGLCSLYFGLMLAHLGTMLGLCWVLLSCLGMSWAYVGFVGLSLAHLGLCCPPGVALGLCSLYFRFMLDHLGTMLGFVGSNAAPRDAAICQSCSCWCSCCASGCSCFCSRCLRGCCAVEVVGVVGAVLCGASRNMLVCCVCCFVARTVLMLLWVHELLTKWMQRPNIRQTGPPHSPIPSPPTPPFFEEEN